MHFPSGKNMLGYWQRHHPIGKCMFCVSTNNTNKICGRCFEIFIVGFKQVFAHCHYVENEQIRTEYGLIQSEYGKIWTRKISVFGHFRQCVDKLLLFVTT